MVIVENLYENVLTKHFTYKFSNTGILIGVNSKFSATFFSDFELLFHISNYFYHNLKIVLFRYKNDNSIWNTLIKLMKNILIFIYFFFKQEIINFVFLNLFWRIINKNKILQNSKNVDLFTKTSLLLLKQF